MKLSLLCTFYLEDRLISSHSDHGFPFIGERKTPLLNLHTESFQIPWMIYNPLIKNPVKRKVKGNFYSLSLPTTILDLLIYTRSLYQPVQRDLAWNIAKNYEFAQSLLRPVKESLRMFQFSPGGGMWAVDNSRNLRVQP